LSTIFSLNQSENFSDEFEIELSGKYYPIKVHRPARARSIIVSADTIKGEVKLGVPRHCNLREALNFVQSKSNWLADRFGEAEPTIPIENQAVISFMGKEHRILWSPEHPRKPNRCEGEIRVGGPADRLQDRMIRWFKSQAREIYQKDLEFYSAAAGCEIPRLSIGDARRRWGSCSGKRAIRLNWRLIMAPPMVRRSVVAHEVAHLRHMDHSKAFYRHLDSIFEGDRKSADTWLKNHGHNLHLIGVSSHERR